MGRIGDGDDRARAAHGRISHRPRIRRRTSCTLEERFAVDGQDDGSGRSGRCDGTRGGCVRPPPCSAELLRGDDRDGVRDLPRSRVEIAVSKSASADDWTRRTSSIPSPWQLRRSTSITRRIWATRLRRSPAKAGVVKPGCLAVLAKNSETVRGRPRNVRPADGAPGVCAGRCHHRDDRRRGGTRLLLTPPRSRMAPSRWASGAGTRSTTRSTAARLLEELPASGWRSRRSHPDGARGRRVAGTAGTAARRRPRDPDRRRAQSWWRTRAHRLSAGNLRPAGADGRRHHADKPIDEMIEALAPAASTSCSRRPRRRARPRPPICCARQPARSPLTSRPSRSRAV